MSTKQRVLIIIAACGVLLGIAGDAQARITIQDDGRGGYVTTRTVAEVDRGDYSIWSVDENRPGNGSSLNPLGDANGDLWPTVAESPLYPHYPWVVWSRFNGDRYDLAWSRWETRGWSKIRWVEDTATIGDDLDPDMGFDYRGRPYVAWWREVDGKGQIMISVYLETRWMAAFAVTDADIDARYPQMLVHEDGWRINVRYTTPDGLFSQALFFDRPVTITDDINPQIHMSVEGTARPIQESN